MHYKVLRGIDVLDYDEKIIILFKGIDAREMYDAIYSALYIYAPNKIVNRHMVAGIGWTIKLDLSNKTPRTMLVIDKNRYENVKSIYNIEGYNMMSKTMNKRYSVDLLMNSTDDRLLINLLIKIRSKNKSAIFRLNNMINMSNNELICAISKYSSKLKRYILYILLPLDKVQWDELDKYNITRVLISIDSKRNVFRLIDLLDKLARHIRYNVKSPDVRSESFIEIILDGIDGISIKNILNSLRTEGFRYKIDRNNVHVYLYEV